jgi:hypothetical protein
VPSPPVGTDDLQHIAPGQVALEQDPGAVRRDGRVDIELLRARMGQDAQAAAVGVSRDEPGRRELVVQNLRPHDPAGVRRPCDPLVVACAGTATVSAVRVTAATG